jgi:hypothetical protein
MNSKQREIPIADQIVMLMDGLSIEEAQTALREAGDVLLKSQTVSAQSPLFMLAEQARSDRKSSRSTQTNHRSPS